MWGVSSRELDCRSGSSALALWLAVVDNVCEGLRCWWSVGFGSFLFVDELGGGLLGPVEDLAQGLGQGVDDYCGFACSEALDGEFGGLVGVFAGVPKADDDAVVGEVVADALADGSGLGEGEGRKSVDEDDGVGFAGEGVEYLAGDGGGGEKKGLVGAALHELAEHERGELVGLIVGGDADDGELAGLFGMEIEVGAVGGGGLAFAVVG